MAKMSLDNFVFTYKILKASDSCIIAKLTRNLYHKNQLKTAISIIFQKKIKFLSYHICFDTPQLDVASVQHASDTQSKVTALASASCRLLTLI